MQFLVPHHTMYMRNFDNRANFLLPNFGGFTRFGGSGESIKHKISMVSGCSLVS